MAKVLGRTPEKVLEIGVSMGFPPEPDLTDDQLRRIHITAIRQNWHAPPDDQFMELLGWDQQHYEYTLDAKSRPLHLGNFQAPILGNFKLPLTPGAIPHSASDGAERAPCR
jgi:hypothetical protein